MEPFKYQFSLCRKIIIINHKTGYQHGRLSYKSDANGGRLMCVCVFVYSLISFENGKK